VGVIGLGAGTLATYGRPIDHYTFYDINPLVPGIARTQFRFLTTCMAPHEIVLGDARLSLEREQSKQFDVLAVDAFSGDAIPVHLLTRQAYALYWRHLKPDGVLAVHVSNRYLSLAPGVALAAAETGKQALLVSIDEDDEKEIASSDWVLVSSRPGFFEQPEIKEATAKISPIAGLRTWTDDYSNLYKILR
jgi:spermidine synthase